MTDDVERALLRQAQAGDPAAAEAWVRAVERQGGLDTVEDAVLVGDPVSTSGYFGILAIAPEEHRLAHAPRLARLGLPGSRELLARWFPAIGVVLGTAEERQATRAPDHPPPLRPLAEVRAACDDLIAIKEPSIRIAALLASFDRLW